ncbi:MAG: hypothetical protein JNL83_40275 [Myxococcales bacterium]|nr:hypothetical protein [Myxococcales bacterium]
MRFLAIVVAGLGVLAPSVTWADGESAETFRARGEQLAKDGRYSEAIDAFKQAERMEPRARHSCLIALAYTRRELWPQAEIFLEQCESRATPADPLPEWVPVAKQQLAERLAAVNVARVELRVEPPGTDVKLAVSSFAPDELFSPRAIHLPPGRHVVIATAKGYNDAQKTVEVSDKSPQTVTITMLPIDDKKVVDPGGGGGGGGGVVTPAPTKSKIPLAVMATGGGIVLAGAALHLFYYRPAREDLATTKNLMAYNGPLTDRWRTRRAVTIGVYSLGAATVLTGLILGVTVFKKQESGPQVSVTPTDGGGMVSVGWSLGAPSARGGR